LTRRTVNGALWRLRLTRAARPVGADGRRAKPDVLRIGAVNGAYALVAAAAALPRLAVLAVERDGILAEFTEKSDDFAVTLVSHGTFGFIPGEPSAYTQPLYGFFLAGIYWPFGRSWIAVGLVQIAVAVVTAGLVYEIGRRFVSARAGLAAALIATLNPYLIWHDVHVNREVLDTLVAAALVLATLLAAARRSLLLTGVAGGLAGLAVLGNARLVGVPLVVVIFLFWRSRWLVAPALALGAAALVVTPWLVRNKVELGCFAITTDARALWKANNELTYDILARGGWIDDVPRIPGSAFNPEETAALYRDTRRVVHVDECAQMRFYRGLVTDFWREQPGEKTRLAVQAGGMLWDPRVTRTEGRAGAGGLRDAARTWSALYFVPLFALAAIGILRLRREAAVLVVALLVYATIAAIVFVGATRYRVSFDFLLALAAGALLPGRNASRYHDQELVQREFADEERLVNRRLDRWADYRATNPEDVALEALAEIAPERVLEIGPGRGEFAMRVRQDIGAEVVAIDVSSRLVEVARERGVDAQVADVQQLPFGDAEFDAAVANWVLYFVPDLNRGIAELARVLRPGGRLVAVTNSDEHMIELWSLVGDEPLTFSAENGETPLRRHFASVERRDVEGEVVFPTREALLGYLAAFGELHGDDVAARLPDVETPFRTRVRNAVFVADKS